MIRDWHTILDPHLVYGVSQGRIAAVSFDVSRARSSVLVAAGTAAEEAELRAVLVAAGWTVAPGGHRRATDAKSGASVMARASRHDPLTRRERKVLVELARGLTYGEIGVATRISINTVRTHVRNLYGKLNVTSRTGAVVAAFERGLIRGAVEGKRRG